MFSIIICTHNPNRTYLEQTLASIQAQQDFLTHSQLLVIDNSSADAEPVAQWLNLSWHPDARIVREPRLGLTTARLTGFREARHDLLVYVDDDNILAHNYFKEAVRIANEHPELGIWGGGRVLPRFEAQPEEWTKQYWYLLALRDQNEDYCSNKPHVKNAVIGAGMCVRRQVVERYASLVEQSAIRSTLDPIGNQLNRAGDQDILMTAFDLGFSAGVFKSLQMQHIMPAFRLTEEYLLRLVDGYVYSNALLAWIRQLETYQPTPFYRRAVQKMRPWFMPAREGRFYRSATQARLRAERDYREYQLKLSTSSPSAPPQ
jgi:glycosyltransferase involved in cell wall biosynthesis